MVDLLVLEAQPVFRQPACIRGRLTVIRDTQVLISARDTFLGYFANGILPIAPG